MRLRSPERSQPPQLTPLTDYDLTGLSLPNAIHTTHRFPVDGEYVIRVSLGGERPPGSAPLQVALWLDGQQIQLANSIRRKLHRLVVLPSDKNSGE